jgi:hypothetical protein
MSRVPELGLNPLAPLRLELEQVEVQLNPVLGTSVRHQSFDKRCLFSHMAFPMHPNLTLESTKVFLACNS